jgi:hypothetical protein
MAPRTVCRYLKDLVTEWGAQIYAGAIGHEKGATNDSQINMHTERDKKFPHNYLT